MGTKLPLPKGEGEPQFSAYVYCGQTVVWIKMKLGMQVGLGPGHIVLNGDPALPLKKGAQPPIFGPCLLWPNGWMDQDATWYGGRPRPRRLCVRWGPSSPSHKKGTHPQFCPISIVPKLLNGSQCHLVRWRPRPGQHCVRRGPSSIPRGTVSQISAQVCCGQRAGWTKMPIGTKVGLGPDHIVLDGDPALPSKKGNSPQFSSHVNRGGDRGPPD